MEKIESFIDVEGRNQEVRWLNTSLADYLMELPDCYQSGTAYFVGFILPGGEIMDLMINVDGAKRYITSFVPVVMDGHEINGFHYHDLEEFRKYSEFGIFKTVCVPLDGNEPSC